MKWLGPYVSYFDEELMEADINKEEELEIVPEELVIFETSGTFIC